jgi:uncharacterized protein (TIGR03437 family)
VWFRLAAAAAVLAPGVPAVAQQTLAIDLNLSGLAHFVDTGKRQVRRYVSMGYGTVTPVGSASYAMSPGVDANGTKGLNRVFTIFLPGGPNATQSLAYALAAPPLPQPLLPVAVTIGGVPAVVEYAGGAPGLVAGVLQVNVRIPDGVPSGDLPVVLKIGDALSQEDVTVAVQ